MDERHIISIINKAHHLGQVLNTQNEKEEFRRIATIVHPDRATTPGAADAMAKLNQLRKEFLLGKILTDDAGSFHSNGYWIKHAGDDKSLRRSFVHYRKLKSRSTPSSRHFHQYLPSKVNMVEDELHLSFNQRIVHLQNLKLPGKHIRWILSRMLEFAAWISQEGYVHAGLTPESISIVPKTHGIVVHSFYHLKPRESKLDTLSGRFLKWYPTSVFKEKRAIPLIDTEMAKRTAVYLFGETSGNAAKLKRTEEPAFVSFLLKTHRNAYEAFSEYRDLIDKVYGRSFHPLDL